MCLYAPRSRLKFSSKNIPFMNGSDIRPPVLLSWGQTSTVSNGYMLIYTTDICCFSDHIAFNYWLKFFLVLLPSLCCQRCLTGCLWEICKPSSLNKKNCPSEWSQRGRTVQSWENSEAIWTTVWEENTVMNLVRTGQEDCVCEIKYSPKFSHVACSCYMSLSCCR